MNTDKYIFIAGPTAKSLNSALQELADLYGDSGYTEGIKIYQSLKTDNRYLINFTNEPDFERFKYFVNYLHYPEVTDYKAKVMGFWTVTPQDKVPKTLIGKRLLIYVSDYDTEGDNVYAIYDGAQKTSKLGFAIGEEFQELDSKEFDFVESQINNEDYQASGTISPAPKARKKLGGGCVSVLVIIGVITIGLYLMI
ncbi:hypothetical protein QQ020_33070 [Fulvivirgaceae bacterium BMA12]|uniref:Uncharacterized protein n=1 Tax=Agaribacillus aureus TaxID=3051825 RepID=A0ABT8LJQ3_9BACT|nr:hypothetical protein [Fulvivirgaceae bacterium BMA12]